MANTTPSNDLKFHIDPLGQQMGLWNLYTQLTFCYPLSDISTDQSIINNLTDGLRRLSSDFPWIAGQVKKEQKVDGESDYFVIRPFEQIPRLVIKDLRDTLPKFEVYGQAGFPISLLNEDIIAPRNTKSLSEEDDPKPVLLIQASFISGGLLLTFAGQHGTMDMVGQAEIIKLLSKACHGIPFTKEELRLGNQDRRTIVSPVSDHTSKQDIQAEHTTQTLTFSAPVSISNSEDANVPTPSTPSPKNTWANFTFSGPSLHALKEHATNSTKLTTAFISTDDTLSAFTWQSITRARSPRYNPNDTSTFARTVDTRRYLAVPPTYPGNLATKTFTTYSFRHLLEEPLGAIASRLRQGIDPKTSNLESEMRGTIALMSSRAKNERGRRPSRDLARDIAFSSWAKVGYCHELDFGLGLGGPEAVVRPSFAPPREQPMEGVVYLLPRNPDGEITVTVCLREEDMLRLRADEVWVEYARYIG